MSLRSVSHSLAHMDPLRTSGEHAISSSSGEVDLILSSPRAHVLTCRMSGEWVPVDHGTTEGNGITIARSKARGGSASVGRGPCLVLSVEGGECFHEIKPRTPDVRGCMDLLQPRHQVWPAVTRLRLP